MEVKAKVLHLFVLRGGKSLLKTFSWCSFPWPESLAGGNLFALIGIDQSKEKFTRPWSPWVPLIRRPQLETIFRTSVKSSWHWWYRNNGLWTLCHPSPIRAQGWGIWLCTLVQCLPPQIQGPRFSSRHCKMLVVGPGRYFPNSTGCLWFRKLLL